MRRRMPTVQAKGNNATFVPMQTATKLAEDTPRRATQNVTG